MALWSRLFSGIFGVGVGIAAADAVQPVVEVARQEAWKGNANRVLSPDQLAALLAQGLVDATTAVDHSERSGYDADKLDALAQLALHAPAVAEAMRLWRLGGITQAQFVHALRKAGIEPQYDEGFLDERTLPLAPADLANAVQQGFVPNAGLLPSDPGGALPITPPVDEIPLDTLTEFSAGAVDDAHAKVLSQLVGLPPGVIELLDLWNRGAITETAVERGIREGHTKTKWTSALKELRHFLLSPADAAGLRLRGWITKAEAETIGARRGADAQTMEYLYLNRGRPAAPGQMATAAVRGIDGPAGRPVDQAQFTKAIVESDIRPEYAPLLWESRFLYPSLFQLNRLVTGGTIDAATGAQWARKARYAPEVVAALEASWSGAAGGTAAKWAGRAQSRLYTVAHNEFLDSGIDEAQARTALTEAGVSDAEQTEVLRVWTAEKAISRLDLTPAEIRREYRRTIITEAEALIELEARGMEPADAARYLQR